VTYLLVGDSGHALMLGRTRDVFFAATDAWLTRHDL
jgi:hypothetical protein